ncbi:hypothetical protein ABKN59_010805 [Abortiporus biennis]
MYLSIATVIQADTLSPWRHVSVAPIVESVTLNSRFVPPPQSMVLRELLKYTVTPSLSHLNISDNQYDWLKAAYPRTLTKLEIQYQDPDDIPYAEEIDPVLGAWVVLKNLPLLQCLRLNNVFPSWSDVYPDIDQTAFPSLKEIFIKGWGRPIIDLYSHMTIPSDTIVQLSLRYESPDDWIDEHPKLSQCVFSHLKGDSDPDESSLQISLSTDVEADSYVAIYAHKILPIYRQGKGRPIPGTPDITIFLEIFGDNDEDIPDIELDVFLRQLASSIPLDKLEILDVSRLDFLVQVLQPISLSSKLSQICLNSIVSLDGFLDIIMGDEKMFPALRSLEISHRSPIEGMPVGIFAAGRRHLRELCQLLALWKNGNGRELESIHLISEETEFLTLTAIVKSLKSLVTDAVTSYMDHWTKYD